MACSICIVQCDLCCVYCAVCSVECAVFRFYCLNCSVYDGRQLAVTVTRQCALHWPHWTLTRLSDYSSEVWILHCQTSPG